MKVKVIFLDFDGVITTLKSGWSIDPEKIDLLKKIIDATDAKIVVSSSWRRGTLEGTIKELSGGIDCNGNSKSFPFCDRIIGVTARIGGFRYNDEVNEDGRKPTVDIPRGVEIQDWLENTDYDVESYVILDDDSDMLYWQKDNFVKTDTYLGLNENNVNEAINILNKKSFEN